MNKNYKIPEFCISNDRIKGIAIKNLNGNSTDTDGHNIRLPHRDDHYMLVMLKEGILKASIDSEEYEFSGPCLIMVFPKQVHLITPQTDLSGWAISFEEVVLSEDLKLGLKNNWEDVSPSINNISVSWFKEIDNLLTTIGLLNAKPLKSSRHAIIALITGLLYIIIGNLTIVDANDYPKKKRPFLIKQQFLHILYDHYKDWKKPSIYAKNLHITTAHLNDTIKKITGKSATETIQQHCVLEAQRLLLYTDLDINEISCQIGYFNASHFIKIFKSITGMTPAQFRKVTVIN
jgi:AraC family transcriptional activator of pobA